MTRYAFIVPAAGKKMRSQNFLTKIVLAISAYICFLALLFLGLLIWQFQNVYFRILDIPLIDRKKYVIMDRYKLLKLTFWQKLNCMYCEYANGIVAYAKAVVNQMELYSCAIKHETHPLGQEHQKEFYEREKFE